LLFQEAVGAEKLTESGLKARKKVEQLKPLMRDGKPFFVIGAYGAPKEIELKSLREAGWNTILEEELGNTNAEAITQRLSAFNDAGLTGIVGLHDLIFEDKEEEMRTKVRAVRNHPALLGYYLFDEPENLFYAAAGSKTNTGPKELDAYIRRKIGWANQSIRGIEPNPEHYTFGCIAWWNEYRYLQPLCDVNLPNEYPTWNTTNEFEGPNANIVYDARLAAEAAQTTGQGFVYTPEAADLLKGVEAWRSPTANEFRYSAFAPFTQGAMGIIFWTANRCSKPYAEKVVFPITRQLSQLVPFFLGKWLDESLVSEPSESTTALLKQLKLPAVSGCLRQADDSRYLILAVNNTPNTVDATFHLSLKNCPTQGKDFFDGSKLLIKKGVLKQTLVPYGVCACIFTPKKH